MKKETKPKKPKKIEEVKEELVVVSTQPPVKVQIAGLAASFGQEDLNKVVDKINEIIRHLNNVL